MTSDLYQVTSNIYAAVLAAGEASPVAPELEDEKTPAEAKKDDAKKDDASKDEAKQVQEQKQIPSGNDKLKNRE